MAFRRALPLHQARDSAATVPPCSESVSRRPSRPGTLVALSGEDLAAVDAFHGAALGAGAADNSKPRLRPDYHATYYAAFVIDPNGNNLEATCHVE